MARVDYDRQAARFDAGRALSAEAAAGWRDAVAPYLASLTAPLLDLGSGTGRFAELLAGWFALRVVGVEPSAGMRRAARRNVARPDVSFAGGVAEALPLRDASCGAAWLSTVIHHFRDLPGAARELRRVLVPGAPVLVRSWFPGTSGDLLMYRYFPSAPAIANTFPTVEDTVAAFASAGFAPEHRESVAQESAPSLRAYAARVRTRADTTLELLDDEEFERGLAWLDRDAAAEQTPQPVVNTLELLVLR